MLWGDTTVTDNQKYPFLTWRIRDCISQLLLRNNLNLSSLYTNKHLFFAPMYEVAWGILLCFLLWGPGWKVSNYLFSL